MNWIKVELLAREHCKDTKKILNDLGITYKNEIGDYKSLMQILEEIYEKCYISSLNEKLNRMASIEDICNGINE